MLSPELIKKTRLIELHSRHLVNDAFAGRYQAIFRGQGMEFEEVRPYQPGDEVRMIDWNVTARMGVPYVKRHVEERELTVILLVDASGSSDFGTVNRFKRELAAELSAVLSFAATSSSDKVGLLIFTDRVELFIPPRRGRNHVTRLIRDLLAFQPQGIGTDIKLALDTVSLVLKRRSIVFLVSDFLVDPETYRRSLFMTNRRHDIVAIDLHDPMEMEIPDVGILALEDAEAGVVSWIDTSSASWRRAFKSHVRQLEVEKSRTFASAGVDCIQVTTDKDYMAALAAFFRKRSKRPTRSAPRSGWRGGPSPSPLPRAG